jgi:hypothetical protein
MRLVNPLPMGSSAAAGQSTDAMKLTMAKAYGSRGGRKSARRRKKSKGTAKRRTSKRKSGGRKLKFGSPAWRKKYSPKRKRK